MSKPVKSRIEMARRSLRTVDGLLITNIANVRYLTGFTGSSGCVFIATGALPPLLLTDFRYKEQAKKEASGCNVLIEKNRLRSIRMLLGKLRLKSLAFESTVSYEFFIRLNALRVRLKPVRALVEKIRAIKDSSEIGSIRKAVSRAETAFLEVMPFIRTGARERAIALRLEERLKKNGCKRLPFDIIVASGPNSAMPHAKVTDRRLEAGDLVIIDWGGEADGYFSDMTRTLLIKGGRGKAAGKKAEIYRLVLEANKKAIASVSDGVEAGAIDNIARDVIKKAGYASCFGHSLGHGVGIEVHERPHIRRNAKGRVRDNMVFTVEPGIYVPGMGGVRIEDMVMVKGARALMLTSLPKGLKIIS